MELKCSSDWQICTHYIIIVGLHINYAEHSLVTRNYISLQQKTCTHIDVGMFHQVAAHSSGSLSETYKTLIAGVGTSQRVTIAQL